MNRESVESGRMRLFVEGDKLHNENPPQFRPIAPKNNTTALQRLPQFFKSMGGAVGNFLKKVGTVYKRGLRVGVSENISKILPLNENGV